MEKCKNCNKWLGYNEKCSCHNKFTNDTAIDVGITIAINSLFNDSSSNDSSSNTSSFEGGSGGDFGGGGSSGDF